MECPSTFHTFLNYGIKLKAYFIDFISKFDEANLIQLYLSILIFSGEARGHAGHAHQQIFVFKMDFSVYLLNQIIFASTLSFQSPTGISE